MLGRWFRFRMALRVTFILFLGFVVSAVLGAPQQQRPQPQPQPQPQQTTPPQQVQTNVQPEEQRPLIPEIDWGKCPQLQPTEADREQKRQVIEQCLQRHPPPEGQQFTGENIDRHREQITTCALKTEGWFNQNGTYKFTRAKEEIQTKKLNNEVESSILKKHDECKKESVETFPDGYIAQVQLYQACMDYHIYDICEIALIAPDGFSLEGLVPGQEGEEFQTEPEGQGQPQDQPQTSQTAPAVKQ